MGIHFMRIQLMGIHFMGIQFMRIQCMGKRFMFFNKHSLKSLTKVVELENLCQNHIIIFYS